MSREIEDYIFREIEDMIKDLKTPKTDYAQANDIDAGSAVIVRDKIIQKRLEGILAMRPVGSEDEVHAI